MNFSPIFIKIFLDFFFHVKNGVRSKNRWRRTRSIWKLMIHYTPNICRFTIFKESSFALATIILIICTNVFEPFFPLTNWCGKLGKLVYFPSKSGWLPLYTANAGMFLLYRSKQRIFNPLRWGCKITKTNGFSKSHLTWESRSCKCENSLLNFRKLNVATPIKKGHKIPLLWTGLTAIWPQAKEYWVQRGGGP